MLWGKDWPLRKRFPKCHYLEVEISSKEKVLHSLQKYRVVAKLPESITAANESSADAPICKGIQHLQLLRTLLQPGSITTCIRHPVLSFSLFLSPLFPFFPPLSFSLFAFKSGQLLASGTAYAMTLYLGTAWKPCFSQAYSALQVWFFFFWEKYKNKKPGGSTWRKAILL